MPFTLFSITRIIYNLKYDIKTEGVEGQQEKGCGWGGGCFVDFIYEMHQKTSFSVQKKGGKNTRKLHYETKNAR